MSLSSLIVVPLIASLIAMMLPSNARNREAWLSGIVAFYCVANLIYYAPTIFEGEVIIEKIEWLPFLGLNFIFQLDGFSWVFALLVSIMGFLVVIYARYYMDPADPVPRFFSFFLIFMASMIGVVISGHLIQLVIFWEMTSLSSFMLIGYWHHRSDAQRGARIALTVTALGGFSLLAAMLIIGNIVGSYEYQAVLDSTELIANHPFYPVILILLVIGALTKSAQFPFHFWLPNAMAAPTPVSAYLHSATLVKAGVILLARFWPVMAGTDLWFWTVGMSGLISLTLAAYIATFQRDMKSVLAYSTISHLGLITLLLGLNSKLALVAAIFHMINHATFKASLFMATGIVDHETGTRDMSILSGLRRYMPLTTTLAVVAAAAMAGVPLLNGFISKEMFFSETLTSNDAKSYILPILALVASIFSVAYSYRFIVKVFFGPEPKDLPRMPHDPHKFMLLPSAFLVFMCIVIGIFPGYIVEPILKVAMRTLLPYDNFDFSLHVFHGFNIPLVMSILALLFGFIVYLIVRPYNRVSLNNPIGLRKIEGRDIFDWILDKIDTIAYTIMGYISSNRLQSQIFAIIFVSVVVAALPLLQFENWYRLPALNFDLPFALMWIAGCACAVGAAYQAKYNRFRAIVLAGVAGVITCATFVWLSAPDLALTQLVIEVINVVLLLLGLRWLPRISKKEKIEAYTAKHLRYIRDGALATTVGLGLAFLTYQITTRETVPSVGKFFLDNALSLGGGTNVVNVILVDFRAFDTYGEITVLGIVALTVYALLRRFRPPKETLQESKVTHKQLSPDIVPISEDRYLPNGTMLAPTVLARLIMPLISVIAYFFFFRGHNLPGGGFIAGVIFAIGVIIQYMISGIRWVEELSRIRPHNLLSAGLLCAAIAGIYPMFHGLPFLSAMAYHFYLPLIGEIHISSVLLFDLGVFMLVIGATTYMLVALAHQSLRSSKS